MLTVAAPALPVDQALRCLARGQRPFLLDGWHEGRFAFLGCDPDDGFAWSSGDAGDPYSLLEAAQRRWTSGPVDENWPIAIGTVDGVSSAMDFARYRAVLRIDLERELSQVLAHDAATGEALLARLRRPPQPLHAMRFHGALDADGFSFETPFDDEASLTLYLEMRKVEGWARSAYIGGDSSARCCATPQRALRVETTRAGGRYETWVHGDRGGPVQATQATASLLGSAVRAATSDLAGWVGAGRALEFSLVETSCVVSAGRLVVHAKTRAAIEEVDTAIGSPGKDARSE